jgi:hypothetical protein
MNHFVHGKLGHFLMDEIDGEGNDLGGAETEEVDEPENGDSEEEEESEPEEDEVVVTIGDEPVAEPEAEDKSAPKWVKDLRKDHREAQRRIRELEAQVQASQPKVKTIEVGPEPSLDDDDIDYDQDKFKAKWRAWSERKSQADRAAEDQRAAEKAQQDEWQARLNAYADHKSKLKVKDYEDAEVAVQSSFDVTQQGIIVQGADNPALVVYALGKNPAKAKELSSIKDPIKFTYAVAKLEAQLKVQNRKSAPAPERTISGSAPSGSGDSNLERLRKEAERTGDYTKVSAYKKQQRENSRAKS